MPLYEYFCKSCDTSFERRRPASEFAESATCVAGHKSARRVVSLFATVSNGRSLPPMTSMPVAGGGCACGGGCGCG